MLWFISGTRHTVKKRWGINVEGYSGFLPETCTLMRLPQHAIAQSGQLPFWSNDSDKMQTRQVNGLVFWVNTIISRHMCVNDSVRGSIKPAQCPHVSSSFHWEICTHKQRYRLKSLTAGLSIETLNIGGSMCHFSKIQGVIRFFRVYFHLISQTFLNIWGMHTPPAWEHMFVATISALD